MAMLPLVIQIERTQERLADTCAFANSPVRIGRNALSDLQLDESFVSQWHGVIRFDEEHTTYLDLGSTNPTLIDGKPVQRNVEIQVTDKTDIRIGSLRLHLLRVPADPDLFGARRKTSFARATGVGSATSFNSGAATMYLGNSPVLAAHKSLLEEPPKAPASAPPPKTTSTRPAANPSTTPRSAGAASTSSGSTGLSATGVVARERGSAEMPIYDGAARGSVEALYADYAHARAQLIAALGQQLQAAAPAEREALCAELFQRYAELAHEPALRSVLGKLGIETWRTGVPDTSDWLRRLTGGLFPPPGQPTGINPALALERIGEVLEVFSSAFIELRTAHTQFCEEMALDKPADDSLLHGTHDPRAVLAYLLNPDTTHSNKITELARAMADFAVHPVALVSAAVEGAREVLQALSPATLAGRGNERPGASFIGKLLGADQRELWTRYVTVFDETLDADRFTRKLFGRGFARKYYAITGGRRSLPSPPSPPVLRPGPSVRP
jgi:predicted component of type VI protein secretion system